MKNLFKNILVLAVMFGTFTSYAVEGLETSSNSTFKITKGNLISVKDNSGKVIYSGRTNYNGNLKTLYNFTKLKDGLYSIEIDKDFEIITKTIEVKNHYVTYLGSTNETIFKPVIKIEEAKLLVSQSTFQKENVEIEIYYKDSLIHSEAIVANSFLKRVYKLDENVRGAYTAIIRVNDRTYVEDFKL
jgi:hypothetical protein